MRANDRLFSTVLRFLLLVLLLFPTDFLTRCIVYILFSSAAAGSDEPTMTVATAHRPSSERATFTLGTRAPLLPAVVTVCAGVTSLRPHVLLHP